MKKFMNFAFTFKPVMLMYFAGGTFMYMFVDLVLLRNGTLRSDVMWQIMLASFLATITHYLFYLSDWGQNWSLKKKTLGHLAATFSVMLAMELVFRWSGTITAANILLFSGLFLVIYCGLWYAFYLYYSNSKTKMNEQLEKFKSGEIKPE